MNEVALRANDVLRNDVGLRPMKLRFAQTELDRSLGFDSEVFRNFVDAFWAFRVCSRIRTGETVDMLTKVWYNHIIKYKE